MDFDEDSDIDVNNLRQIGRTDSFRGDEPFNLENKGFILQFDNLNGPDL